MCSHLSADSPEGHDFTAGLFGLVLVTYIVRGVDEISAEAWAFVQNHVMNQNIMTLLNHHLKLQTKKGIEMPRRVVNVGLLNLIEKQNFILEKKHPTF